MLSVSNTLFIGKELHHLGNVDSTNAYLHYLVSISKSAPSEGLVVFTDNQFAGRGQRGTKWLSEAGQNIMMSVLLYPRFLEPRDVINLNKIVSLALSDVMMQYVDDVSIKWPNDIYVGRKKVAGILIETVLTNSSIQQAIIGIGCNINQTEFSEEAPNASSIKSITGKETPLNNVFEEICCNLEEKYLQLRSFNSKKIDAAYFELLYALNKNYQFRKGNNIFEGIIRGINADGKLLVEINSEIIAFTTKEISYVND